jgi:hypothetical protein
MSSSVVGDTSFLSRLAGLLPRIKTRLQLSGLAIAVGAWVAVRTISPNALKAQISAGAIGIAFVVFGQVFSALGTFEAAQRAKLIIALFVIFCIFVLSLIVVTSLFVLNAERSTAEQEVSDLQDQIIAVVGAWEGSDHNPGDRDKVVRGAPKLTNAMLSIPDTGLRPEWQIVKYEYGLYAATMTSSIEEVKSGSDQAKREFAVRGLTAGDHALAIISKAENRYLTDKDFENVVAFVRSNDDEERIRYLRAICFCQLFRIGEIHSKEQAKHEIEELNRIQPSFAKSKYPILGNPEFAGCIE